MFRTFRTYMFIFHACVARLAKSMLSNTCAFQITLSSYFSFLMTLPLATLTSLLLTPSWCWVLGEKSGPSSNISHLRLSPLIILLLSVLVVRRSFHQGRSTTYKKNFYDSAAHLFMFRPCSTFLSHKHALDWEQFKVVLWQNFREFRMGLLVLAAVPHISIDLFLPPTQSDLLPTDSPSPAEKLYSAGNSLWPGECMTTFIPPSSSQIKSEYVLHASALWTVCSGVFVKRARLSLKRFPH